MNGFEGQNFNNEANENEAFVESEEWDYGTPAPTGRVKSFFADKDVKTLLGLSCIISCAFGMHLVFGGYFNSLFYGRGALSDLLGDSFAESCCVSMLYTLTCVWLPFFVAWFFVKRFTVIQLPSALPKKGSNTFALVSAGLGLCIIFSFAANILSFVVTLLFPEKQLFTANVEIPDSRSEVLLAVLQGCLFPAVFEEFAFRGVLLHSLKKYGDWFAILMSALWFGMAHTGIMQVIFAMLAGMLFGYIVTVTQSIWPAVAVHFLNNLYALAVSWTYGLFSETAASLISFICEFTLVAVGLLMLAYYVSGRKNLLRLYPAQNGNMSVFKCTAVFFLNPVTVIFFVFMFIYNIVMV